MAANRAVVAMQAGSIVALNTDLAIAAARAARQHKLPTADSIIYATAQSRNATVWTQDDDFKDLRKFVMPLETFAATTPVIESMNNMRKQNLKIVLVGAKANTKQKKPQRPLGIVTMKDLVEELTGELAQW